jgi:hypothetical protein
VLSEVGVEVPAYEFSHLTSVFMEDLGREVNLEALTIALGMEDTEFLRDSSPSVTTFSFETEFWADAPATVDAIVLSPGTTGYEMLAEFRQAEMPSPAQGEPLLYVTRSDFGAERINSVSEIKSRAEALDGHVVSVEANVYQQRISSQETLEHATTQVCGEELLEIQTPQGPSLCEPRTGRVAPRRRSVERPSTVTG